MSALSVLGSVRLAAAQNFPPDPLAIRMPDDAVHADVELIVSIAARLGVPFGFEAAGALSERVSMPFITRTGSRPKPLVSVRPRPLDVRGVTLRQALDAAVRADRRYEWRDAGGVVVVRPRTAWRDPEHPLLREVAAVHLRDARMTDVFDVVRGVTHIGVRESSGSVYGEQPVSFDFAGGTLLDLLNALARAHGHLQWSLTSDVSTIQLDGGRAVTVGQPVLILGVAASA